MKRYTDLTAMVDDGVTSPDLLDKLPPCVKVMKPEFVEYVAGKSLTFSYPVLEIHLNPQGSMQGGFICAAFDNTFGMLVYLVTKKTSLATIDLSTAFHRPVYLGDKLIITAHLRFQGNTIIHLYGEAQNLEKKLVASSSTNLMLLND